jgi:hypothetical protein
MSSVLGKNKAPKKKKKKPQITSDQLGKIIEKQNEINAAHYPALRKEQILFLKDKRDNNLEYAQ